MASLVWATGFVSPVHRFAKRRRDKLASVRNKELPKAGALSSAAVSSALFGRRAPFYLRLN
jgi:hypothetical protein